MRAKGGVLLATLVIASIGFAAAAGCGSDRRDLFVRPFDAGTDGDALSPDADPNIDPTLGGPCIEDLQCDDGIACTYDKCDAVLSRCRNTPDDTQCDDGIYCNGKEKCVLRQGCTAGPVVTCQDDNLCTIDRCVEATKSCVHDPRDVDQDGDPDDHCQGHADCDDTDPTISSKHAEICGNFKDDNCNGEVDELPCSSPANDVCANALAINTPGVYSLSTVAATKNYVTSCTVTNPAAAEDVVVAITPPGTAADPQVDIEVWASAQVASANNQVALALEGTCGDIATERACSVLPYDPSARAIVRAVTPGTTTYAIITTQSEAAVDVKVDIHPKQPKPTNEDCTTPQNIAVDAPFTVKLIDPAKDLPTACAASPLGELTYRFTLAAPQDVRIFASTLAGSGQAVVSLRDDATCATDEIHCRASSPPALYARNLAAGPHIVSISGSTQLDASILVKTYPPTTPPPNQQCGTAPPAPINTSLAIDLSNQEEIKGGCIAGGPSAAYNLQLTEASDVLVVGRFPFTEGGAVWLAHPACGTADLIDCTAGSTPVRVSKRNVPPGSYRVMIADQQGQNVELSVLVRPTIAPTAIAGSDGCADFATIPAAGGFFTGDTTGATADFSAGCDAPGGTIGGARDQMLRLDLAAKERLVFDMTGSTYTTLLDLRAGATCPGIEVPKACSPGFSANRSFLDVTLDPGTYWVQVDGYATDRGPWNLDVRTLPP